MFRRAVVSAMVSALAFAACKPTPPAAGSSAAASAVVGAVGRTASGASGGRGTSGTSSTGASGSTGACIPGEACTAPTVPTGTCCGASCVDTQSDLSNCGQCGTLCKVGQECVLGVCVGTCGMNAFACVLGPDAGIGLCCGTACVDVNTDAANCGICGAGCLPGGVCADGQCTQTNCAVDGADQVGCFGDGGVGICCAGACVDTTASPLACSQCGQVCPGASSCVQGACSWSDGGLARCASDASCPQGMRCDAASGVCAPGGCGPADQNSACERPDAGGLGICCSPGCTDPATDSANCGSCGNACNAGSLCLAGHCLITRCSPATNQSECIMDGGFGTCCSSTCRATPTDPTNCGFCGVVCDAGMSCSGGLCL